MPAIDLSVFLSLYFFLCFRHNGRPGPYFRNRGRGSGPPHRSVVDRKAKSVPSHLYGFIPYNKQNTVLVYKEH